MADTFEQLYPHIARWVTLQGWVEIGPVDFYQRSFVRALDEGGMIWEGAEDYPTLDDALHALDDAIGDWLREQGFEK